MCMLSVYPSNPGFIISKTLFLLRLNVTWRRRVVGGRWSRIVGTAHWTSTGRGRNTARALAVLRESTGSGTQRCTPSPPLANTTFASSWRTGTSRNATLPTTTSKWPQRHRGETHCRGTNTHFLQQLDGWDYLQAPEIGQQSKFRRNVSVIIITGPHSEFASLGLFGCSLIRFYWQCWQDKETTSTFIDVYPLGSPVHKKRVWMLLINVLYAVSLSSRYRLTAREFSGDAGNALSYSKRYNHDSRSFSTADRDHDRYAAGNCGQYYGAGWWFDACLAANLNGRYYRGRYSGVTNGIYWGTWYILTDGRTGERYSFKKVEMKTRPRNFVRTS